MDLVHKDTATKFTLFFNLCSLQTKNKNSNGTISQSSSMILLFRFGWDQANGPFGEGPAGFFLLRSALTFVFVLWTNKLKVLLIATFSYSHELSCQGIHSHTKTHTRALTRVHIRPQMQAISEPSQAASPLFNAHTVQHEINIKWDCSTTVIVLWKWIEATAGQC